MSRGAPGARRARTRRRWSLRTRLVVSSVALIAVVCAVIGTVTALALQSFLYAQLDGQVAEVAKPVRMGPGDQRDRLPEDRRGTGGGSPLAVITRPGVPPGTVGAQVDRSGEVVAAGVSSRPSSTTDDQLAVEPLTAQQAAVFADVPPDGAPHTLDVPGLGAFRVVRSQTDAFGQAWIVGLPTASVRDTIGTLVVVEVCVTAAGLAAAGLAGFAMIRLNLRPLRRVAATATRVSELTLHHGEVALHERMPDADTDPRTEVGQVGAALNRMLDHVGSALHARQESEARVRQFVADASHELRTPLTSIRGYAELTRRGREAIGPDTRHALGRIESEAARMTTLVEDLLLLARLDAGRPLSLAGTDLSPLVVDAVGDARAAGRDHRWRLELPDDPAVVRGDPQRLHQVLTNLLANARTHTPPGTTVVARVVPHGPEVRVEVADNGPGIPPALLPHVFERFARGDASRSRAAGSTGLGLAIVQAVVAAHGGRVSIDSRPGATVFRVHLPAAHSQAPLRAATPS
ncbi:HAMP domain-containing sensor histidine kinase [Streptomyces sp. NPDC046977]|uniref:HAMP domain-containing sensor histidine kinase n=1 Tax=Streptomyces sp. NPDC046977 TaxID=3154703 RepID=UPI0033C50C25